MEELNHYEGQVKNGRFHGKGKLTSPNGIVLEGTFVNGSPDGEATLSLANGKVYLVRFENGKAVEKKLIKGGKSRLSPFKEKPVIAPNPKMGGFFFD
jgi:hypothetical protein